MNATKSETKDGAAVKQLVGPKQLEEVIGTPKRSIQMLAREGKIPAYRIGGRWRFDVEEVLEATRTR